MTVSGDAGVALGNWRRMVGLCMGDYLASKFQGSKLAALLALAEPLLLLGALVMLRIVLKQSLHYYGTSMMVFYASGIFPYYFFLFVSTRGNVARINLRGRLPGRMQLDYFFAVTLVETLIIGSTMILLFSVLWLMGFDEALPENLNLCLEAVILMIVFGMGVGLINQSVSKFFPLWSRVYGMLTRGMMFLSGVFVMPDMLPPQVRDLIVWNPLMHGIEWFRLGLYGQYPHLLLDPPYLAMCALSVLFFGLVCERAGIRSLGLRPR